MLVAEDLKDLLISNLDGITDATLALSTVSSTISTYIKDNAEISFSWVASNPSGDPDPTITAQGEIVSLDIEITPSLADNQASAFVILTTQVTTTTALGIYNITDTGFVTSSGSLSSSPSIGAFTLVVSGTDQEAAMLQFAQAFVDYIILQLPTSPCSGTHGTYTGIGTITSIE